VRGVRRKECVVVGIGNPFMGDDGVGIEVARALRRLELGPGVLVLERQTMDISALGFAEGASKLVIVDAIKSGKPAGTVVKFTAGGAKSPLLRVPLAHELDLQDVLGLAKNGGMRLPPTVVVGVEPADCTAGNGLSAEVAAVLPRVLNDVRKEVKECLGKGARQPG